MYSFTIKSLMVLTVFVAASTLAAGNWAASIMALETEYTFVNHQTLNPTHLVINAENSALVVQQ